MRRAELYETILSSFIHSLFPNIDRQPDDDSQRFQLENTAKNNNKKKFIY